jgi:hypothetical protein
LNKLIPTLCALVCVAVFGVMMTHGLSDLRHEASHAAVEQAESIGHDHAASHGPATDIEVASGNAAEPPGSLPAGHHHHGGGDSQAALPSQAGDLPRLTEARGGSAFLRVNQLPEGLIGDGPEHPPKQLRTIA